MVMLTNSTSKSGAMPAEQKERAADKLNQSHQQRARGAGRLRLAKNCVTLSRCVSLPSHPA